MELNEVKTLARTLMDQHGLSGYRLFFMSSKNAAGKCWRHCWDEVPEFCYGKIGLSEDYMKIFDEDEVRDTILHEIAHALTNPKYRPHGPEWRAVAVAIGSSGERCISGDAPSPKGKWTGVCRGKGCEFTKHRLAWQHRYNYICPKCEETIDWYETKNMVVKPKPVVAAVKERELVSAGEMSWKEKYDRGMTVIDW